MKQSIQSLSKQFGPSTMIGNGPLRAVIHCQVIHLEKRPASNGKPFFDIHLGDGGEPLKLKVWNNSPAFRAMRAGEERSVHRGGRDVQERGLRD